MSEYRVWWYTGKGLSKPVMHDYDPLPHQWPALVEHELGERVARALLGEEFR